MVDDSPEAHVLRSFDQLGRYFVDAVVKVSQGDLVVGQLHCMDGTSNSYAENLS